MTKCNTRIISDRLGPIKLAAANVRRDLSYLHTFIQDMVREDEKAIVIGMECPTVHGLIKKSLEASENDFRCARKELEQERSLRFEARAKFKEAEAQADMIGARLYETREEVARLKGELDKAVKERDTHLYYRDVTKSSLTACEHERDRNQGTVMALSGIIERAKVAALSCEDCDQRCNALGILLEIEDMK